jgi:hypothetical protein
VKLMNYKGPIPATGHVLSVTQPCASPIRRRKGPARSRATFARPCVPFPPDRKSFARSRVTLARPCATFPQLRAGDIQEPKKEPLMDANKREYGDDFIFKDEVFHIWLLALIRVYSRLKIFFPHKFKIAVSNFLSLI